MIELQPHQLLDRGRFEDALACFQGEDVRARFGRAVATHLLGRLEEAEAAYEHVLAIERRHAETLANLVALNIERFDLGRVEMYSKRLLEIEPESQVAMRGLVVVAVERRDHETAAKYFARLDLRGDNPGDAVEYRLSRQVVERLKDHHGSLTNPD